MCTTHLWVLASTSWLCNLGLSPHHPPETSVPHLYARGYCNSLSTFPGAACHPIHHQRPGSTPTPPQGSCCYSSPQRCPCHVSSHLPLPSGNCSGTGSNLSLHPLCPAWYREWAQCHVAGWVCENAAGGEAASDMPGISRHPHPNPHDGSTQTASESLGKSLCSANATPPGSLNSPSPSPVPVPCITPIHPAQQPPLRVSSPTCHPLTLVAPSPVLTCPSLYLNGPLWASVSAPVTRTGQSLPSSPYANKRRSHIETARHVLGPMWMLPLKNFNPQ